MQKKIHTASVVRKKNWYGLYARISRRFHMYVLIMHREQFMLFIPGHKHNPYRVGKNFDGVYLDCHTALASGSMTHSKTLLTVLHEVGHSVIHSNRPVSTDSQVIVSLWGYWYATKILKLNLTRQQLLACYKGVSYYKRLIDMLKDSEAMRILYCEFKNYPLFFYTR